MGLGKLTSISILVIHFWVIIAIWGLLRFRGLSATLLGGMTDGMAFPNMYNCRASGSTLSQSSWQEVEVPIQLQSPDFVAEAHDITGRNFSIHCYDPITSAISNEQRTIYAPVPEAFVPELGHDTCHPFHVFTMQDACQCLRPNRVILGFGDSLTRRIMESWMTPSPKVNQYSKETRVPDNVTVLEESSLLPCENVGSRTRVYKLTAWLFPHLKTKILPTLNNFHSDGQNVDLLLIGFGLHTILDQGHSDWEYWISETVSTLTKHPATKYARIFWMLPHQVDSSKFPAPRNVTDRDRNIDIQRYNNLVVDLVREKNWTVLDFYNLTESRGHQTSDGVHFWPNIYRWKNQHVLNSICPRM